MEFSRIPSFHDYNSGSHLRSANELQTFAQLNMCFFDAFYNPSRSCMIFAKSDPTFKKSFVKLHSIKARPDDKLEWIIYEGESPEYNNYIYE